ncbi:retrotransposable element ORF2 protein [Nymphaea thermarum]|nr:retrotransposable element ORF2 protein [Nymphaea thermarum]
MVLMMELDNRDEFPDLGSADGATQRGGAKCDNSNVHEMKIDSSDKDMQQGEGAAPITPQTRKLQGWAGVVAGSQESDFQECPAATVDRSRDEPTVVFPAEAYQKMEEQYRFAVVAGFYGGRLNTGMDYRYVFQALRKLWINVNCPKFSVIGSGRFLVRVSSEEELREKSNSERRDTQGNRFASLGSHIENETGNGNQTDSGLRTRLAPDIVDGGSKPNKVEREGNQARKNFNKRGTTGGRDSSQSMPKEGKTEHATEGISNPFLSLQQTVTDSLGDHVPQNRFMFAAGVKNFYSDKENDDSLNIKEGTSQGSDSVSSHNEVIDARQRGTRKSTRLTDDKGFVVFGVYLPPRFGERLQNLYKLEAIVSRVEGPVMLIGDFNAMLNNNNKSGSATSDHSMLLYQTIDIYDDAQGQKLFRFFKPWLMDKEGKVVMLEAWRGEVRGCPMMRLLIKFNRLHKALLHWNRHSFGNLNDNITTLQSRLEECREQMEQGVEGAIDEEHRVRKQLSQALLMEEVMWKQRSRICWLAEGDKNTSFFHAMAKSRQAKRKIRSIEYDDTEYVESGQILEVCTAYFRRVLDTDEAQGMLFEGVDSIPKVTDSDNEQLLRPILEEEVYAVVWSLDKDSAAGLDGFPNYFYQECWPMVSADVVKAVKDFFSTGKIVKSINETMICLIPKRENTKKVDDYRPISLCNTIYKIITKVIVNRMRGILGRIINANQVAFSKGRHIHDNILWVNETFNSKDFWEKGGCCLKLDLMKAYDRVSWIFLENSMKFLGFHPRWIDRLMQCITSVSYRVFVNGRMGKKFHGRHGLRQGDPLSPYLFLIVMEMLNRRITKDIISKRILLSKIRCVRLKSCAMMFADDVILLVKATKGSISAIKVILVDFDRLAGMKVNKQKSEIFANTRVGCHSSEIQRMLQWARGDLPSEYLGLPLFLGNLTEDLCLPLLTKVEKRLASWKARLLSYAGRLPTLDRLKKTGIQLANRCSLCFCAEETNKHVLIQCKTAKEVWRFVAAKFGRMKFPQGEIAAELKRWLQDRGSIHEGEMEVLERILRFHKDYGGDCIIVSPIKEWVRKIRQAIEGRRTNAGWTAFLGLFQNRIFVKQGDTTVALGHMIMEHAHDTHDYFAALNGSSHGIKAISPFPEVSYALSFHSVLKEKLSRSTRELLQALLSARASSSAPKLFPLLQLCPLEPFVSEPLLCLLHESHKRSPKRPAPPAPALPARVTFSVRSSVLLRLLERPLPRASIRPLGHPAPVSDTLLCLERPSRSLEHPLPRASILPARAPSALSVQLSVRSKGDTVVIPNHTASSRIARLLPDELLVKPCTVPFIVVLQGAPLVLSNNGFVNTMERDRRTYPFKHYHRLKIKLLLILFEDVVEVEATLGVSKEVDSKDKEDNLLSSLNHSMNIQTTMQEMEIIHELS